MLHNMINLIKEQKELFKNQIIDYLNYEIGATKDQLKDSIELCDQNYFTGSVETLIAVKEYIKDM